MYRSIIPTLAVAVFGMAIRVRLVRDHTNFAKMYQKLIRDACPAYQKMIHIFS
jgi:hypothetical protein